MATGGAGLSHATLGSRSFSTGTASHLASAAMAAAGLGARSSSLKDPGAGCYGCLFLYCTASYMRLHSQHVLSCLNVHASMLCFISVLLSAALWLNSQTLVLDQRETAHQRLTCIWFWILQLVAMRWCTGLHGRLWIMRSRLRILASAATRLYSDAWGLGLGTPRVCMCWDIVISSSV